MVHPPPHAATPALRILAQAATPHIVHAFESGTDHFGEHAAAALGVDADRVFKTLVVALHPTTPGRTRLGVCCLPVSYQLSMKKAARGFAVSTVSMADPTIAARSSGSVPGGISPIGHKTPLPTLIDETAHLWDTIYVSAGRRGLDVELSPTDLAHIVGGVFVDLIR